MNVKNSVKKRKMINNVLGSNASNKKRKKYKKQKKMPLVSVITVVRNILASDRKVLFLKMLQSVKKQDYQNIEHIIVDGKSTDGTVFLIKEWQDAFSDHIENSYTCKWISEKDNGVYDAMNKGVCMASGEYIIFLNSDDELVYNALSVHVHTLKKNKADCSMSSVSIEDNNGKKYTQKARMMRALLGYVPSHQGMMISKKAFISVKYFNTFYRFAADFDIILRLYILGYKITCIEDELSLFRVGGISGNKSGMNEGKRERVAIYMKYYGKVMKLSREEVDFLINTDYREWVKMEKRNILLRIIKKIEDKRKKIIEKKKYTAQDIKEMEYVMEFYSAFISVFCIDSDGNDPRKQSIIGSIPLFAIDTITFSRKRKMLFFLAKIAKKAKVYTFLNPVRTFLFYINGKTGK